MTSADIEIAVSHYFNIRANIIVPNVSWGLRLHECDLLVLTKNGYAYEVEIKVSRADLIKDASKPHNHDSKRISRLYFAIPAKLKDCVEFIPERAGILVCDHGEGPYKHTIHCRRLREAAKTYDYQWPEHERLALARLGAMRVWSLKLSIRNLSNELHQLKANG